MFAADTQVAFWMQWFTMDSDTHPANRWFLLKDGRKCASNGSMAVVSSDETDQIPGTHEGNRLTSMGDAVTKMLAAPHEKHASMPHAEAVKLFGECAYMSLTTCTRCKGKKLVPHVCGCDLCEADVEDCYLCNGDGLMEEFPEIRYVTLWSRPFDANKVAYILAHAPATIAVDMELIVKPRTDQGKFEYLLRITTARWQAVLVELTPQSDRGQDSPELMGAYA